MFEKEIKKGEKRKKTEGGQKRERTKYTEQLHMENLSFTEFGEYKVQTQSLTAIITLKLGPLQY